MIQYSRNCLEESRRSGRRIPVAGAELAGSTSKKIVGVRFDREPVQGFVNQQSFLGDAGVELLTASGSAVTIPYAELKAVCFVRDFDSTAPVWKEHRAFPNRPKMEGLWVRLEFRDGDTLEGVLPNDLMLVEPAGVTLSPPDPGFQNQRVFVPRAALVHLQVLGVVGSPLRRKRKPPVAKEQLKMFE